jgi:hypothetical protein
MKYRALDAGGDMRFGHGLADFLIDTPEAVAQAVRTRLQLLRGEWFLDKREGTPYQTKVLGRNTGATRDPAIRRRILGTQGVTEIVAYSSTLEGRSFSVSATINTVFGQTTVEAVL